MEKLIKLIALDHPNIVFRKGGSLRWSPKNKTIDYIDHTGPDAAAGLLHELGHAKLEHQGYISDTNLLEKEIDAWHQALEIGKKYGLDISRDHIEDCLDSYRAWIYKRSLCPSCELCGLQKTQKSYLCLNCGNEWLVSASRHCRSYRKIIAA